MGDWSPGETIESIEREAIIGALRYHQGCRTRAAQSLKIALRTLGNKINKYKSEGHKVPEAPVTQYQKAVMTTDHAANKTLRELEDVED